MNRTAFVASVGLAAFALNGCASVLQKLPFVGKKEVRIGGVYKDNLDPDRVVDLVIVKKLTGSKRLGLFPKYAPYLEGYIRGVVVDYDDNPIEGVVVRAVDKSKDMAGFDPAVSDANGVYKIRFSLPIKKNRVDIRGSLSYNPPWQQQIEILGASLEPQTKETTFRMYYNRSSGMLGIGEDTPKTIVRKATPEMLPKMGKDGRPVRPVERYGSGTTAAPASAPPAPPKPAAKKNEDFFGGFGDFGN